MGACRRIAEFLLTLDATSTGSRYLPDPQRDTNRIHAIVERSRHRGHRLISTDEIWQELHDGLWGLHARPVGLNADSIAQRGWIYERLLELVSEERLVEDPDYGGPYGQFWHTSTSIARVINASGNFREAIALTRDQLQHYGDDELLDAVREAEHVMVRLKATAQDYSRDTGIGPRGRADLSGPRSHPPRVAGDVSSAA
ncbi:hypothetical protein F4561_001351 [Lipingzhangella halophila]|uniref:Uncharacterized protein n=1 Tax=Lipingzhangella halophila TaxID=1783352 RepID=A0A7W7REL5_9ACTN|nr:hypothetical protein [Lipingzhangella halophila]MBB4930531.1 hypothetical protein [Lipingzhangella halophila]